MIRQPLAPKDQSDWHGTTYADMTKIYLVLTVVKIHQNAKSQPIPPAFPEENDPKPYNWTCLTKLKCHQSTENQQTMTKMYLFSEVVTTYQ